MHIKCEIRHVPRDVIIENFAQHVQSIGTIPTTTSVVCVFNPDTESFMDGTITFSGAANHSRSAYRNKLEEIDRVLNTRRVEFSSALFLEGEKDEQKPERFSSGFDLGRWAAQGSLPSMFRGNIYRTQSVPRPDSSYYQVDMPQGELSDSRENRPRALPMDEILRAQREFTEYQNRTRRENPYAVERTRPQPAPRVSTPSGVRQPSTASWTGISSLDLSS